MSGGSLLVGIMVFRKSEIPEVKTDLGLTPFFLITCIFRSNLLTFAQPQFTRL